MTDVNFGLIDVSRPKGTHLFRVYSMKNRERFEFFYRTQLVEWVRLEFDAGLLSFEPVNKVFKTTEGRLFVAFKLGYLNSETFVYFAEAGTDKVVQAFEQYCSALGMDSKLLGREIISKEKFEVWNRFKILSFIVRWKDEITAANLKLFVFNLSHCTSCSLSNFDRLDGFGDGRGLAFALELVRIGRFQLPSLREQLIGGRTIVVCSPKGYTI
ncbi:hypothetical protein IAI52_19005 [Pseudomonas lurida]|uniref:hypothetical protein n=1 Tax=Pseudomonas lurida TaxID=244566 RepID=UPI001656F2DF|nr:hypothetical protein [Pseudomonas lurida]MBC8982340.1 hypothetical protein [Pseudomonas lurida]